MADWERVQKQCDKIETATLNRIQRNYNDALKRAVAASASFLKKVEKVYSGEIKPPSYYVAQGDEAVRKWREGFIHEMMRRENVAANIADELQKAGVKVPEEIRDAMQSVYRQNYEVAADNLKSEGEEAGITMNFSQYDKRQLDVLMDENEGVFSKIAYSSFQNPALLTQRLQDQLFQATTLGESQRDIIKRIRNVTGYEYKRAKRIAQTERTRVQSQARYQAGEDAKEAGVGIENEWSCAMMTTSRDTHKALNGQRREQGEWFDLIDGDRLRYPGDPAGKACNIINCYCVLIPHVQIDGKKIVNNSIEDDSDTLETDENGFELNTDIDWFDHNDNVHNLVVTKRPNVDFPDGNNGILQTRDAYVYSIDGVDIIVPQDIDKTKQDMPVDYIINALVNTDRGFMQHMQHEIFVVDYDNPMDAYWEIKYGMPGFHSYATGGKEITFYAYTDHPANYVAETIYHEGGHLVDEVEGITFMSTAVSNSDSWTKAVSEDLYVSLKKSPTDYGEKDIVEDFAESVKMYYCDNEGMKKDFPNRYNILQQIFGGVAT